MLCFPCKYQVNSCKHQRQREPNILLYSGVQANFAGALLETFDDQTEQTLKSEDEESKEATDLHKLWLPARIQCGTEFLQRP